MTKKVENGKIEQLEIVLKAMTRKVLSLEREIVEIKKNKGPVQDSDVEDKENKTEKKISEENCPINNIYFNSNDIKNKCSTPKKTKDKAKKVEHKEMLINCNKCNYQCKKQATLDKHILTKHDEHVCKECPEKLSSFMELLKHVAKHHHDNEVVVQGKVSEDSFVEQEAENLDKYKDKGDKDSSFIFEESMLDEFLEKKL